MSIQDDIDKPGVSGNTKGQCAKCGYRGTLLLWTAQHLRAVLELVLRDPKSQGFQLLRKRWIVERTLAWWGNCRRLSKGYETLTTSGEAMIYIAMIRIMLRRLA